MVYLNPCHSLVETDQILEYIKTEFSFDPTSSASVSTSRKENSRALFAFTQVSIVCIITILSFGSPLHLFTYIVTPSNLATHWLALTFALLSFSHLTFLPITHFLLISSLSPSVYTPISSSLTFNLNVPPQVFVLLQPLFPLSY